MNNAKQFLIETRLRGIDMKFKTTWGLFAYKKVDGGTKMLLENVSAKAGGKFLDLGCGYGAIGITLAREDPTAKVWMADRDLTALEYSLINSQGNGVKNIEVVGSNGFENIKEDNFDLVVSNLPSHGANEMLKWIIGEAREHLAAGGQIYVVTVTKLKRFIQSTFEETFGNYEVITSGQGYLVTLGRK